MPTKQENKESGGERGKDWEGVGAKINFRGHIAYRSPK